jgi:hypothetical protein
LELYQRIEQSFWQRRLGFLNSNFNIKVKDTGAISTFFTDGKAWLINSTVNVTTIGNILPGRSHLRLSYGSRQCER